MESEENSSLNSTAIATMATDIVQQYPLISTVVTLGTLVIVLAVTFLIFRYCCRSRSKHDGVEYSKGKHGFFDQFDVNNSQLNIRHEENFINEAASIKLSSCESSAESSNTDNNNTASVAKMSIKSVPGSESPSRFTVDRVKDRSARSSATSLTIKLPKDFLDRCEQQSTQTIGENGGMKKYSLALIDRRSNTIHNIDLRNVHVGQTSFSGTTSSVVMANRWREKSRQKRPRRPITSRSLQSSPISGFNSESLSSHSDDSIPQTSETSHTTTQQPLHLSSIDESLRQTEDSDANVV